MSAIELQNVDDAVDQIARELTRAPRPAPTWSVLGEPTVGKTSVLEDLHERLRSEGELRSVLMSPPPRAYDAGHAALIDLAEGLDLNDRALHVVKDPEAPWTEKLRRVRMALVRG